MKNGAKSKRLNSIDFVLICMVSKQRNPGRFQPNEIKRISGICIWKNIRFYRNCSIAKIKKVFVFRTMIISLQFLLFLKKLFFGDIKFTVFDFIQFYVIILQKKSCQNQHDKRTDDEPRNRRHKGQFPGWQINSVCKKYGKRNVAQYRNTQKNSQINGNGLTFIEWGKQIALYIWFFQRLSFHVYTPFVLKFRWKMPKIKFYDSNSFFYAEKRNGEQNSKISIPKYDFSNRSWCTYGKK